MKDSFKIDQILDSHLQVLRSEDDSLSSLSIASEGNGARVSGNLEVTGTVDSSNVHAGQILGYTSLLNDAADTSYAVTTSFVTIDATTKVTFTAPPSGNVEIFVNIFDDAGTGRPLYLGLSDNATYNTIGITHEHLVSEIDETDKKEINHRWVITGLTAGTSYTYWLGAKSSHSGVHTLKWGGDATGEYAPFIMKATALPREIYDGT